MLNHEVLHGSQAWTPKLAEPALEDNQLAAQIEQGEKRLVRLGGLELTVEQQITRQGNQAAPLFERRLGALHVAFDNTAQTIYKLKEVSQRRHEQPPIH